jgi:4-hydroxyacetophenone monooxygenase
MNRVNERHRVEIEDYIRTELAGDEALIEKCMPDYPPFAKRILIDNGWYSTLRKPHVTLITEAITNLQAAGIQTADGGDHEFDVIIYATGFDVTNLAARIDFRGIDNFSLAQDWADDNPRALLGMTVPQFPNLFILYGPNTNMGHGGSGLWLAETQGRYVLDRLEDMVRLNLAAFNCKAEQRDTYTQRIDDLHSELIWTHPGTRTYYRTKNGHVRSPMPFRLVDYWQMTRSRGIEDFDTTSRAN